MSAGSPSTRSPRTRSRKRSPIPARSTGAGRGLSGPPRAGLSGRLHPVAGPVAQAARLALGGPRAVGGAAADLRAGRRNPGLQGRGILDRRRDHGDRRRPDLPGAACMRWTARRWANSPCRTRPPRKAAVARIEGSEFAVGSVERKQVRRNPAPPFITSTCSRKPRASWASARPRRCAPRSSSMKVSTSAAKPLV